MRNTRSANRNRNNPTNRNNNVGVRLVLRKPPQSEVSGRDRIATAVRGLEGRLRPSFPSLAGSRDGIPPARIRRDEYKTSPEGVGSLGESPLRTIPLTGMNSFSNLWERLVSWENLIGAARKAGRGKRFRPDVASFNACFERELYSLRDDLISGSYKPGPYRTFRVRDGKERLISAAPYRDRVVHHALCNVLDPIWERRFIFDSYACRPGKGTHVAADRYQEFSRRAPYVLQCDISKYFPSIDHEILMEEIRRVVLDRDVLRLVGNILGTHGDAGLLWPAGKGLPLGNQTSQFFGNVYLDRFDHWVKEEKRRRFYLRYVDDFVIMGGSAAELWGLLLEIREQMADLGLELHPRKCRVFPVSEGCDFVGYRIWPTHRRLRRHSGYRFRRRFRALMEALARGVITPKEARPHVMSWIGHAQHADTWGLRRSILG